MKNKNGFTHVEIIVVILLIIGISTSIFIVNINNTRKNNNLHLEKLHNQILEASNVFITTEKDESGENYNNAINMGAKGVQIPISFLINSGYVDEKTVNEVYRLDELDSSKNYFVLAVNGREEDNQDYCDDEKYYYEPSDTFACRYGRYSKYNKNKQEDYTRSSLFYSSPVGFLTYGDVVRASVPISSGNIIQGDSYSLKDESNSYKFDSVQNNGKSAPVWTESIFKANSVKPAIIINLSSKKLNGELLINRLK